MVTHAHIHQFLKDYKGDIPDVTKREILTRIDRMNDPLSSAETEDILGVKDAKTLFRLMTYNNIYIALSVREARRLHP